MPSEKTMTIAGMECLNKVAAAKYIGMKLSTFDRLLSMERAHLTKVHLRYYQTTPKAPLWFPKEFLDSFVLESISKGGAY